MFEREAIRPNVLGKFSDMLLAVVAHPAMLNYLNNMTSFGPNSRMGKRRNRGLNENLAREILELHTLGVNGGYTQKDVIALAKIITGWTITPAKMGGGGFQYIDVIHEPGTHILLGKSYPQNGQQQGIDALRDLAHHPSTARFIATKLARHFIADNPPDSTIKHLEKVFKKTDGDLKAMAETLIELPEIEKYPLSKIKTPYELIISTMRLLGDGANKADYRKIFQSLHCYFCNSSCFRFFRFKNYSLIGLYYYEWTYCCSYYDRFWRRSKKTKPRLSSKQISILR